MTKLCVMVAAGMLVSSVVFPRAAVAGQIGDRQIRQQERIHQGVVTGELTGREAAALEREQCRIQKIKQRAWIDGELSPVERARLHNLQDRASAHIYKKKHNGTTISIRRRLRRSASSTTPLT